MLKYSFLKLYIFFPSIFAIGCFFYFVNDSISAKNIELVKSSHSSTVYYLSEDNKRHTFPNLAVYKSWYGDDFSEIIVMSDDWFADIPLGRNIAMRSGISPVKVPTSPKVYFVEPGGLLRHIDNEEVAEFLYGKDWPKKVIDIPEVFFSDYEIGEPLENINTIPDGLLYKISGENNYYWKQKGILQKFTSLAAIRANNLDPENALISPKHFYSRTELITGKNILVFSPPDPINKKTADCEAANLKIAFLFIYQGNLDNEELSKVERLRNKLPDYWHDMSAGFSKVDTSFPTYLLKDSGEYSIRNKNNRFDLKNEIVFNFYDHTSDVFDFVVIFTDFPSGIENRANFLPVTNYIGGLRKITLNRSDLYGSSGKLKGVITIGDITEISLMTDRLFDTALNLISHEMLHNWSSALYFMDDDGEYNKSLLTPDLVHWSPWVDFSSPLGGLGWKKTGEDTYQTDESLTENLYRTLSDLDLYTMGLLPWQAVKPVHYIDTQLIEPTNTTIKNALLKEVTIKQIIEGNGKWECRL